MYLDCAENRGSEFSRFSKGCNNPLISARQHEELGSVDDKHHLIVERVEPIREISVACGDAGRIGLL